MKHATKLTYCVAGALALACSGCIVIAGGSWVGFGGPCVWIDADKERIAFDPTGLQGVKVKTHNGAVAFTADAGEAYIVVRKRAGGLTLGDAHDALDAIEVHVDRTPDGTQRIGWRWAVTRKPHWRAEVNFDIHAPGDVALKAETHNGKVQVAGVSGDVRVITHNGDVDVDSSGGRLNAETHNGSVRAAYIGDDVILQTHNGTIVADLTGCTAVQGRITTHNGRINVTVGDRTSAMLQASTHNGGIKCGVPLQESDIERRRLRGRIGTGDGSLTIVTHNGSVRIHGAAG